MKSNSIVKKLSILFSLFLILILSAYIYIFYVITIDISKEINIEIPKIVSEVDSVSKLDNLASQIKYYDEVLTQSARNYAYTGEFEYKEKYNATVSKLDQSISVALEGGDEDDKKIFENINNANLELVRLETSAIEYVNDNNKATAVDILNSDEYETQKQIYKKGLEEYFQKRGSAYDEILKLSTTHLEVIIDDIKGDVKHIQLAIGVSFLLFIILFLLFYAYITKNIKKLVYLKDITDKIANGNLDQRIEIATNDEIGKLSESFNKMIQKLDASQKNIENKVEERTKDLEEINRAMIGRELKMVELKKKIEELEKKKQ